MKYIPENFVPKWIIRTQLVHTFGHNENIRLNEVAINHLLQELSALINAADEGYLPYKPLVPKLPRSGFTFDIPSGGDADINGNDE